MQRLSMEQLSGDAGNNEDLSQKECSTSEKAHSDQVTALVIAEKLQELEKELDVNLFQQFELFLRNCKDKDQQHRMRCSEGTAVKGMSEGNVGLPMESEVVGETAVCNDKLVQQDLKPVPSMQGDRDTRTFEEVEKDAEVCEVDIQTVEKGGVDDDKLTRKRCSSPSKEAENSQEGSKVTKRDSSFVHVECRTLVGESPVSCREFPTGQDEQTAQAVTLDEPTNDEKGLKDSDAICSDHQEVSTPAVATVAEFSGSADKKEQDLVDADRIELLPISFSNHPTLLASAKDDFLLSKKNNFLKGCKWSPDGTCILTNSEDGILRLFNLPSQLYNPESWAPVPDLKAVLQMVEGELIYDYSWYPGMSSLQPDTCCFVSASRGHPVHMWDAFDGQQRCSYRPHNHMDELITPHSLCYSLDGTKLYCGFNKLIKIFDTTRPGKQCQTRQTKGKLGGQTGIISCFAMNPDGTMFAAGSYSKTIGIYTDSCSTPVSVLSGQANGVTHLMYSIDGHKIYSGSRKDNSILCWDVRNSSEVLFSMERNVTTNQRMYFDIDRDNRYLLSGNQDGSVSVWDLNHDWASSEHSSVPVLDPVVQFEAHEDTTNGVSLHPSLPLLATASGQRRIFQTGSSSDGESDEEEDSEKKSEEMSFHNSLRIWSLYENR